MCVIGVCELHKRLHVLFFALHRVFITYLRVECGLVDWKNNGAHGKTVGNSIKKYFLYMHESTYAG